MDNDLIRIRLATEEDAGQIRRIYEPYVAGTAVSFEYAVPTVDEMRERIRNTLKEYPYLVVVENGRIVGYTYASAFHSRQAYKHSVELSIYLEPGAQRRGLGRRLYDELAALLVRQNVFMVYACITYTDRSSDAHLSDRSIRFHESCGFRRIGSHPGCGYKFDSWYGIVWMEKLIADKPEHPEPFIPFPAIRGEGLQ